MAARSGGAPHDEVPGGDAHGIGGWRWWTAVLAAAIVLRAAVALVLLGKMPLVSDARDYFDMAVRLSSGDVGGAFYWPPGESLTLACAFALFGQGVFVARLFTIATSVAVVPLTALLARELAGERAARVAAWISVAYAPNVLLSGQTYAQHLAALCLAAVAYFGLRALRERRLAFFVVSGAALGLGCLTRPSMASLVPVFAVALIVAARRDRSSSLRIAIGAALAACVALAVVVPAQAHNARAGAGWSVSTNNERNVFLGNNPYTPDYKTSHLGQRSLDELDPDARAYLESFYSRPDARKAMQQAAVAYVVSHPLRTAWRTINRATSFWGFDYIASREIQKWRGFGTVATLPLLALEAASYLVVAAAALIAIFALGSASDAMTRAWLIALALAYEVPYAIAFSGGTYHFPVSPLLVPFAALTFACGRAAWHAAIASKRTIAALCVFVAVQAQYAYFALALSDAGGRTACSAGSKPERRAAGGRVRADHTNGAAASAT